MRSDVRSAWRSATLDQLVALQRGHDLPERLRRPGSVPVLGSAGVSGWHDEVKANGPGVVIGRAGASMGVVTYCREDYWPLNTALYATDFRGNHPRFVYYFLKTIDFQGFDSGSVQPMLNRNFIKGITVSIPPLDEQIRIADFLGALDDKVESNYRLSELLTKAFALHFVARFQSLLGELPVAPGRTEAVPEGWTSRPLSEIAILHRDFVKGASALPYIGLDSMPQGSSVLTRWVNSGGPDGQAARFERGDILFGKLRPYFKKVGVAPIAGRCSREILVIRPAEPEWYGIVLGTVSSDRFVEHCVAVSSGTRMPRAEWKDAAAFPIAVPPRELAAELASLARSVYERVAALTAETHTLTEIKSLLLPRLISGEIRVPASARPSVAVAEASAVLVA